MEIIRENRFSRIVSACVRWLGFAAFVWISFLLWFIHPFTDYQLKNASVLLPNIGLLAAGVLVLALVFWVERKRLKHGCRAPKMTDRQFAVSLLAVTLLLAGLLMFAVSEYGFQTGWDVNIVQNAAEGELNEYFNTYPNNVALMMLIRLLRHFAAWAGTSEIFTQCCFTVSLMMLSVYLSTLCVWRMTSSRRWAVAAWLLGSCLFGISPWATIPYSDTLGIALPAVTFFLWLQLKDRRLPLFFKILFVLLPAAFGYLIKPQCAIVLIAMAPVLLFHHKLSVKRVVSFALAVLCVGAAVHFTSSAVTQESQAVDDPDAAFGWTHMLMMGLNTENDGAYSQADVNLSAEASTKEERTAANMQEIRKRISEMGLFGLIEHLARKTMANYGDGTFAWGREGYFYASVYDPTTGWGSFLQHLFYTGDDLDGYLYPYFATFAQTVWLFVLFGCLLASVFAAFRHRASAERQVLLLTLIGITLFTLLFEARARYLFVYAPFYVMLAVLGFRDLWIRISERSAAVTENAERKNHPVIFWILTGILLIASAAVLFCGAYRLMDVSGSSTTESVVQMHKTGAGNLQDGEAKQYFTADADGLTTVEVMFSTRNKKHREGTITLTLTDAESGKVLGTNNWAVADLRNNTMITMDLESAGQKGRTYCLSAVSDCTDNGGVTLRIGPTERTDCKLIKPDGTEVTDQAFYMNLIFRSVNRTWIVAALVCLLLLSWPVAFAMLGRNRPICGAKQKRAEVL